MKPNYLAPAAALVQKEQGLETSCRAKGCSGNWDVLGVKTSKRSLSNMDFLSGLMQVACPLPTSHLLSFPMPKS